MALEVLSHKAAILSNLRWEMELEYVHIFQIINSLYSILSRIGRRIHSSLAYLR